MSLCYLINVPCLENVYLYDFMVASCPESTGFRPGPRYRTSIPQPFCAHFTSKVIQKFTHFITPTLRHVEWKYFADFAMT